MISLDEAVTATLESHGYTFEVLVDPDAALEIKRDEFEGDLEDVIAAEDVFEDASQGDRPTEEALEEVFGSTDPLTIIPEVIKKGEIQITAEQRKKMKEEKRKKIINTISRNAVNPQENNTPHPPDRIERALEEAGFRVDAMMPAEDQVQEALDDIRPIIPIRFDEIRMAVKVPPEHAGAAQSKLRGFGKVEDEEWQSDGSLIAVVKFPAGMQNEFYEFVNQLTGGEAETRKMDD